MRLYMIIYRSKSELFGFERGGVGGADGGPQHSWHRKTMAPSLPVEVSTDLGYVYFQTNTDWPCFIN